MGQGQRSITPPYSPLPAPRDIGQLAQYLDDELHRIKDAWPADFLNYTILTESITGVPLTATPTFGRVFDGVAAVVDTPPTQWELVAGVWTCVAGGIYQVDCEVALTAPGAGNKDWFVALQATIAGATRTTAVGGTDNFPQSTGAGYTVPLVVGDQVFWDVSAVTDTPGGATTDYEANATIWRLA